MSLPIRSAGWGTAPDGSLVTWTVSEGRRGRRWREVLALGDAVTHALLLETDPDGRFSHLELARADGLWTFHPEGDGTLHGNHVDRSDAGVRHIDGWRFDPGDTLLVAGSPLGLASVVHGRRESTVVGSVVIEPDGRLRRDDAFEIERLSDTRWRVGASSPFDVDDEGIPVLIGAQRRPLEQVRG